MIQKKPAVEFHSGLFPQYSLLLGLDLAKCVAVIGQTILAHPVRQPERPALGAGHDTCLLYTSDAADE